MTPLVSILIPAYNAEPWLGDAIRSALDQTWTHTEIIVVNDGSKDRTLEVANQYASAKVRVLTHDNQGASATRNRALREAQGDYIQWLDADDILDRKKVACQLARTDHDNTVLLSSAWARYYYRRHKAVFSHNELCRDHTSLSWMQTRMETKAWMAIESWLVSRHLAEKAGPWDTSLSADDDGEYFARIVYACSHIRYIPEARSLCRLANPNSLSKGIRTSYWLESKFKSLQKQISYLRSLDDSQRSRQAGLVLLQHCFGYFYPDRKDIVAVCQVLAQELGGSLYAPKLRSKYHWLTPVIGWDHAKTIQNTLPHFRSWFSCTWDHALYQLERWV